MSEAYREVGAPHHTVSPVYCTHDPTLLQVAAAPHTNLQKVMSTRLKWSYCHTKMLSFHITQGINIPSIAALNKPTNI